MALGILYFLDWGFELWVKFGGVIVRERQLFEHRVPDKMFVKSKLADSDNQIFPPNT